MTESYHPRNLKDIIVVDDDVTTRCYLRHILNRNGFSVRLCSDGSEACWEIASQPPAFILSDWQMPSMDGAALCKWVRKRSAENYIYFILMTAHERFFDVIDGLDAGADDYLRKPFDMAELRSRLRCGERILNLEKQLQTNA